MVLQRAGACGDVTSYPRKYGVIPQKTEMLRMVLYAFPGWFPAKRWFLQNLGLFIENHAFGLSDSLEHFMLLAKADICFVLHYNSH